MKTRDVLISVLVLVLVTSCTAPESQIDLTEQEIAIVTEEEETVLDQWIYGIENLDAESLSGLFGVDDEMVSWGVSEGEQYVGWETYKTHIEQTALVLTENIVTVRDVQVRVSRSGDVAWFNQIRDYRGTLADGQEISLNGVRVTGVLEKQNGRWVIVHYHHSIGNPARLPDPDDS